MAISKEPVNQHKRMAMGEKDVGFKKGGKVGYKAGGETSSAETYNGGSGVLREDMTGKRMKRKDSKNYEYEEYKKGGKLNHRRKK